MTVEVRESEKARTTEEADPFGGWKIWQWVVPSHFLLQKQAASSLLGSNRLPNFLGFTCSMGLIFEPSCIIISLVWRFGRLKSKAGGPGPWLYLSAKPLEECQEAGSAAAEIGRSFFFFSCPRAPLLPSKKVGIAVFLGG